MPTTMKFDLWNVRFGQGAPLNFYPLVRPLLFQIDPETIHDVTLKMLARGFGPQEAEPDEPLLRTFVFGLEFPNPLGLAAGLDKNAAVIDPLMRFGFGAVEVGSVTPRPQVGNPRPRLFRAAQEKALVNRFGFNNVGLKVFTENLKAWRKNPARARHPVGVNLGKNKDTQDDAADYVEGLIAVAPYADYIVINVSSPNTPGLRGLQEREQLAGILVPVTAARDAHAPRLPVLVKVAPDLTEGQQEDIAALALEGKIQGLIVGNTTLSRPQEIPSFIAREAGGLSGRPLFELSTRVLSRFAVLTKGKVPLVGCGGVSTGEQAYRKIRAGASLVQLYTSLVYEGPLVVRRIKHDLVALLRRDGFASVADAVGADHR